MPAGDKAGVAGRHSGSMKFLFFLLLALPLGAQPRRPEVFGTIGYGVAHDDEGSVGNGAVYGGAVHVPFAHRWAADVEIQHIRTRRQPAADFAFGTRRTLLSPAIVYRRGSDGLYWFGGAGIGARIETSFFEGPTGRFEGSGHGWTIPLRTGFVASAGRLLVRAELFAIPSFLAPDTGVEIGLGYRF